MQMPPDQCQHLLCLGLSPSSLKKQIPTTCLADENQDLDSLRVPIACVFSAVSLPFCAASGGVQGLASHPAAVQL